VSAAVQLVSRADLVGFDFKSPDYAPVWEERMRRLTKLREGDADALLASKLYYKTHPAEWINDWGVTFDPRNPERGLPGTVPFVLWPKQVEFINWLYARWTGREDGVVEKSRDFGCSWLSVAFAAWMWTFYPATVVGMGSRIEDLVDRIGDPQSLFWKLRMFVRLLPAEFKPRGYDEDKHAPFMRLLNPETGSSVIGEAGKNIRRGARASIYFKDESAFYEQATSIDNSLSMTANCKIDISTPNGEGNPFWQKRHSGKFPVFVCDWRDDPRKGPGWYAEQKGKLTAVALAQEVDRDYSASIGNSFIEADYVTAAQARGPADIIIAGPLRVGLDVARFGDDKTVLSFRRGRALVRQVEWGRVELMSTAGRVKQEVERFIQVRGVVLEQIAVDSIGVGAGVADALRGWFKNADGVSLVVDINSSIRWDDGEHYNMRSFMWSQMKEWVKNGASLVNDPGLRADLTGLRYSYKAGLLLMEDKAEAKKRGLKSPDKADSLALTFGKPGPAVAPDIKIPESRVRTYELDAEMGL